MHAALTDFLDALGSSVDADDAWRLTLRYFAERGAEWLYHGYTAPLWREDRRFLLRTSNIPPWWDRHRDERGYRHHDPAVQHCARSVAPFPFGLGVDDAHYSAAARKMYAESAEWGARCGVAFPLRNLPGSPLGAVVCITRLPAVEFGRWWPAARGDLHLAALAADARLLEFCTLPLRLAPAPELSARERECLLWLAAGYRTDRIAHRLGISNAAVDLHFANAKRKLGARTRDQALLKAVMLGRLVP